MNIKADQLRLSKPQDASAYLAITTVQGGRTVS